MNDRDDYPENPYRGRNDRERGYDYDPLSDPLPAQPPSRGRRARPEPTAWNDGPAAPESAGTGGYRGDGSSTDGFRAPRHDPAGNDAPPPGRRRRAEPPAEPPSAQPRRTGAADALRGGRAARSGANRSREADAPRPGNRSQPQDPPPPHRGPAADPTQDALAALANLGAPSAPARPAEPARPQERSDAGPPPRRARRAQADPEPEPPRRRGAPVEEGPADTGELPVEEETGRRGRRKRGRRDDEPTGGFLDDAPEDGGAFDSGGLPRTDGPADTGALPGAEAPPGRRGGRRRRGAPVEEGPADTGELPVEEETGRRGRRKRGRRDDEPTGGFLDDAPEDSGAFDSGSFPGLTGSADTGAFAAVPGPSRRRGAGRKRADRVEEEPRGAVHDPDPEEEPVSGAFDEVEEAPRSRRGGRRRRRGAPVEETPLETDAPYERDEADDSGADAPEEEPDPEPAGRRSRRRRGGEDEDGEPTGRRGRRKRGGRRVEEPEEEVDEYEEPGLADIAEAYGGGRSSRRKAKELKRARANANRRGKGRRDGMSKGLVVVLVLVLLLVVGGGGYAVMRTYVFPPDFTGEGSGDVVFVIDEGESGSTIAGNLADQGVVASSRSFVNALDAVPAEEIGDGLVPGTYGLAEGMSGEAAVAALLDPANRLGGQVTIREGLRNEQVLEELSETTGVSLEELQEAHAQVEELGLPDYAEGAPAGYLFPATYRFDPDTEAMSILKTMVTRYREVAEEMDLEDRAAELGYEPDEIMAIASIVQAESGKPEDMPKISRVTHNRLDIDMNLRMDSTCFYAIGEYGIALTNEQLTACQNDTSGFDTYHKSGLPPGPFVAPGQDAIEAALNPEEGDWLFFVATDPENGVTEFATTEAEFNELKERFEETWTGGGE